MKHAFAAVGSTPSPYVHQERPAQGIAAAILPQTLSISAAISAPGSSSHGCVKGVMDHTRFVLNLLDRIIESGVDVDLELKRIGAKHAVLHEQFGFNVSDIEKLGEIFAESFFKLDTIRQSKEAT